VFTVTIKVDMMRTLFVENKNMELRYERACILVYENGRRRTSIPVSQLERIVLSPSIALTAGVLGVVVEHEVSLLVINTRFPKRTASLSGVIKTDVRRRINQIALLNNVEFCKKFSLLLVQYKTLGQIRFLKNVINKRPDLRHELKIEIDYLKTVMEKLNTVQISSLAELRGIEGSAARGYFKTYQLLFAKSLDFSSRTKRPPLDPVNACLSLAYTLFHQEAVLAIKTVGLDPAIGFYHTPYYNRESLACDLIEPLRPVIDSWVFQLFRNRKIRIDDFSHQGKGCFLTTVGKKKFYSSYRDKVKGMRRLLRRSAKHCIKVIKSNEEQRAP
jgi:CRISP-associated protein Cas1